MAQHDTQTFEIDPQLAADTLPVSTLNLSDVLLSNDSRYVWCILVPRLPGLRDFHDLPVEHKMTMHHEIDSVSAAIKEIAHPYKMNVAALGNLVEQLHVHVIARQQNDAAWPGPIWGVGKAVRYSEHSASALIADLRELLIN